MDSPMPAIVWDQRQLPFFPVFLSFFVLFQTLLLLGQIFMLVYHDHDGAQNIQKRSGCQINVPGHL